MSTRITLAAIVAAAVVCVSRPASAQTLTSGGGQRFDFTTDGSMIDGTRDSYDICYYLTVGGTRYSGGPTTVSADGRTITFPTLAVAGLNVSRQTYVPTSGGDFARYLEILQNSTAAPITVDATIAGNLGSDSSTVIRGSSNGDLLFTTADNWLQTNDTVGGDPALAHVIQGPGALVTTSAASLVVDNISWTFHVTVPASGRVVLLWFAVQKTDMDDTGAQTEATSLDMLPDTATAGADTYLPDVVNFETEAPCAVADGAACTSTTGAAGTCHAMRCCVGCWDGTTCHGPGTATACGIGGGACTNCTDANTCTDDVCSRTAGTCSHPATSAGTPCNDGLYCTATDTCNGTSLCVGTGTPCDDGNSCTTDSCNEASDTCGHASLADGTACTGGICHGVACCTGCWDGASCQPGVFPATCGASGRACVSCVDGDSCTDDVCSAGACTNPISATGTPCDDGMYCTAGDHCDGADHCLSGSGTPCDDGAFCTTDTCDEATDACMHTATAGDCAIFGSCFMAGDRNPSNRCQVCDPTASSTGWTIAAGMDCGMSLCASGFLTPAPTCDAVGTCVPSSRTMCASGRCADATTCAATCAMDSDCGAAGYCDMTTGMCAGRNPPGGTCTRGAMCAAGTCAPEGVCCATACTGPCVSCNQAGSPGHCLPIPAGTDPDNECAGDCNGSGACTPTAPDAGMRTDAGGADAGSGTDASMMSGDASTAPDAGGMRDKGGCCGVAGAGGRDVPAALAVLGVLLVVARRRRQR